MKNNKVLCIGDSTSLPGHMNNYEDTWFYKLKQEFPLFDIISVFRRSITTNILTTEGGGDTVDNVPMGADCLEFYNPSIVILQLGIVDCAPRLINLFDRLILKYLPSLIKKKYINVIKMTRRRKLANTLVPFEKFHANLQNYIHRCEKRLVDCLILILIPYPDERMVCKNPDIIINIEKYNKIMLDLSLKYSFVRIISILDSRIYGETIFEDGYHPNILGNQYVFNELKSSIDKISETRWM